MQPPVSRGASRLLSTPRTHQAPEATASDRVAHAPVAPRSSPRCSPRPDRATACACGRSVNGCATWRKEQGWPRGSPCGAGARPRRWVCRPRQPADAGDEPPAGASASCHRPATLSEASCPSSPREATGVADRAGASVSPGPIAASGPARWPVWRGCGRRTPTTPRRVPHPPQAHLGRLAMRGGGGHHGMRWPGSMPYLQTVYTTAGTAALA